MSRDQSTPSVATARAVPDCGAQVISLYPERDDDRALRVTVCAEVIRMDARQLAALVRWLYGNND